MARPALQDSQNSAYSRSCEEEHLICSQLLLQHPPKKFTWRLQPRQPLGAKEPDDNLPSESEVVVDIDQELPQRLPVLHGISKDSGRPRK